MLTPASAFFLGFAVHFLSNSLGGLMALSLRALFMHHTAGSHACRSVEGGGWETLRDILCNLLRSSPDDRYTAAQARTRAEKLLEEMKANSVL
jgi:hypothetical protein